MNLSQSKVVNFKLPMRSLSDQGLGIASFLRMSPLGNRGGANGQRVRQPFPAMPGTKDGESYLSRTVEQFCWPVQLEVFAKAPYEDFHACNAVAKSTQVIL